MTQTVTDAAARSRFELEEDGEVAFAAYEREGDVVVFTHTVVPEALRGHGMATRLIAGALAAVRAKGERVVPVCPFVLAYLRDHPRDRDLVVEGG